MHIKPGVGKPRPVGQAIVDNLFASQSGRIPLVGVTGTHGKTPLPSWSPTCFTCPAHAGLACSDGLFQAAARFRRPMPPTGKAGRRLLLNRAVEAAVIENGAEVILGEGLPYDRCSVGVVTNIAFDDEDLSRWDVQPTGGEYYTTPRSTTAPRSMSCCPPAMPCSMRRIRWSPTLPNCATARSSSSPRPGLPTLAPISPLASAASRWPTAASCCAPEPTKSASAAWSTCR
jgi:hypothetical protein